MDTNKFVNRHVGISAEDIPAMLETIGVKSLDELIDQTIPANIRLKEPLNLPEAMTEREFAEHIAELASKNEVFTSYIGMGWYDTVCPAPIQRNVFENPVWYTSYTPYQAEVSQGRLEALLNFQTVISELTGLPLTNCSLLDEATAAAEAVTMFHGSRSRAQVKAEANTVFIDENVFASTLAVIHTRMVPQGIHVVVGDYKKFEFTPDVFAAIVQFPNADGSIEDYKEFVARAGAAGAKVGVAADLMSLVLLTPPGDGERMSYSVAASASVSRCSTGVLPPLSSLRRTIINVRSRDVSSVSPRTLTAIRLIAWPCRPASNISNERRLRPISVRLRRCWLPWPASTPYIMERRGCVTSPDGFIPRPDSWPRSWRNWDIRN